MPTEAAHARRLAWQDEGTRLFEAAVASLPYQSLAEPSALPGWSRAHLVAHLARNADALVNLLHWARTGEETPMYAGPGRREADIAATAGQAPKALRADLAAACHRLAEATASLPAGAWDARVLSAQGRDIPAREVPWLRIREVWVHLVDLAAGATFAAVPGDLAAALLDDITRTLGRRDGAPAVRLVATDAPGASWTVAGAGTTTPEVRGPTADLLCWASGRPLRDPGALGTDDGPLPDLPRWL